MRRRTAAVLGATGAVGQKFVRLLQDHPWFRLVELAASDKSAGKTYGEATSWREPTPLPRDIANLHVKAATDPIEADVVFSAMPAGEAGAVERRLAKEGKAVFTNARDLRMEPDVPLVIAEVNGDHLALVDTQRRKQKATGFVVANGNCTAIVLSMTLKPLQDAFGVENVDVVTMQSLSGAGYPGVSALDATENVIPYIPGEEEKVESEPRKFLGTLKDGAVRPAPFTVNATCTRVPVLEAHSEAVIVRLSKKAKAERVVAAWNTFKAEPQRLRLPSAPASPIEYRPEPDRPQPRRDRDAGNRMTVSVGRLRALDDGRWRFFTLGSNTVRGAAGGSLLNAELALHQDLF